MFRTLPTPALLVLVAALAVSDLVVSTGIAQADDEALPPVEEPLVLVPAAFLTGPEVVSELRHEGTDVRLERTGDGTLAVVFSNPGTEPVVVSANLGVTRTNGSFVSRMGPMTIEVARATLEHTVGPGAEFSHVFGDVALPPAPAGPFDLNFASVQVDLDGVGVLTFSESPPAATVAELALGSAG